MGRHFALLAVCMFGYSLILGDDAETVSNTTAEPNWNETLANNTTERNMTFTTSESPLTTNQETIPLVNSTLSPQANSSDLPNNETTPEYNATSQGPLLNGTGSPASSSSLTDGSKPQSVSDGQRFDTASFIGGIVLAVGVLALGIFLVKVYQSRKGPRSEYNNI